MIFLPINYIGNLKIALLHILIFYKKLKYVSKRFSNV